MSFYSVNRLCRFNLNAEACDSFREFSATFGEEIDLEHGGIAGQIGCSLTIRRFWFTIIVNNKSV